MNPTDRIALDFCAYSALRTRGREEHMMGGILDYSFALDNQLWRKLSSIGPLRALAGFVVRTRQPLAQQLGAMRAIAVGPDQLPELFEVGQHCARTLGIGAPQIFVEPSGELNAWTCATDDSAPSVFITSSLLKVLDRDELAAVIGHECGHVHNLHGTYNTLMIMLGGLVAESAPRGLLGGMTPELVQELTRFAGLGISLFLKRWSRCAEVTCDRAGAICAGSTGAMIRGLIKIGTGGELPGFDVEAYLRQLATVRSSLLRLQELGHSHPITQKRVEALRLFDNSEPLLAWRPELRTTGPVRTRAELDTACERLISVIEKGTASKGGPAHELRA